MENLTFYNTKQSTGNCTLAESVLVSCRCIYVKDHSILVSQDLTSPQFLYSFLQTRVPKQQKDRLTTNSEFWQFYRQHYCWNCFDVCLGTRRLWLHVLRKERIPFTMFCEFFYLLCSVRHKMQRVYLCAVLRASHCTFYAVNFQAF